MELSVGVSIKSVFSMTYAKEPYEQSYISVMQ